MTKTKTVGIYKTTDEGEQELLGSVMLIDDKIHYVNLSPGIAEMLDEGIIGLGGVSYKKTDGMKFLENIQYNFTGHRVIATAPK